MVLVLSRFIGLGGNRSCSGFNQQDLLDGKYFKQGRRLMDGSSTGVGNQCLSYPYSIILDVAGGKMFSDLDNMRL